MAQLPRRAAALASVVVLSALAAPAEAFLSQWFHPYPPVDVGVVDGSLVHDTTATDALLLTQQALVSITDLGPRITNAETERAAAIQQMVDSGLNTIFDPSTLVDLPLTSVTLTALASADGSNDYQLDVAIYVRFNSTRSASVAKFDFDNHQAFSGAFRAVVNIAVQAGLGQRELDISGPALETEYVTATASQNFESVAGQPDDSAQAPAEAGGRSPQHRDGTPVWLVHQPKAKTPKTTKHAKSGPKHAKLRTSRAVQGSAYHAAAYAYGGARESNAHSARGSTIIVTGAVAYICAATLVVFLGYKRWTTLEYEVISDELAESPVKPKRKQKIGNIEVLQWMQSEHIRLADMQSHTGTNPYQRPRSSPNSPHRRSPHRRSPGRKLGAVTSPSRKIRSVGSPKGSPPRIKIPGAGKRPWVSPNRIKGNDCV
jgi:hypothetical protein